MSNRNFGKKDDKWICNHCNAKNIGKCISPYVLGGTLVYLCNNCRNDLNERLMNIEDNYLKECDYL